MTTIDALIERLRGMTGPDREVDAEIASATGWTHEVNTEEDYECWRDPDERARYLPRFTSSVDSALAFTDRVLPGCAVRIQRNLNGTMWAQLQRRAADNARLFDVWSESGEQASLPLAILLATLTALQQTQAGNG